jgi:lysophospholipase L1-like esterase
MVRGLLVLSFVSGTAWAQAPARPLDPDRFEPEIRKFEEADRTAPKREGLVLFIGSSSIRRWDTLARDFPNAAVVNRGFGGSEAADVVRYAERAIVPPRPAKVVFYAGDNDLARGKTPEQIAGDVKKLWEIVGTKLPEVRMAIISVKPSLARWALVDKTRATNALLEKFAASDPRLTYVDVFTPMIGPDGKPIPSHFVADGLHLTAEGYKIWTAALRPFVQGSSSPAPAGRSR